MSTPKSPANPLGTRCVTALLGALLSLSACAAGPRADARSPEVPSSVATTADSHAFQQAYNQQLRDDPVSFLTVVAAHYLAPGDAMAISGDRAELEASNEALIVRYGAEQQRFEDSAVVALDARYTLSISRQEADWRVLVHDRDAPQRAGFPGVTWFPVDARQIVKAVFEAQSPREPMLLQTSRGVSKTLYVAGVASFERDGVSASLRVFAYSSEPQPGEPMLIPFRDATSGTQSYAAGRYLELEAPTGATVVLDFNRAINPLCAYSEHYNCPMPPSFNVLPFAVAAGAQAPH